MVVDAGVLKLKLTDGTHAAMPGLDGVLPANVMHYTADSGGVVRYQGGELVFNEFTLQKVMVYQTDEHGDPVVDEFGQPVQVQATRAAGEPVLHYFGERQYHVAGERVEYWATSRCSDRAASRSRTCSTRSSCTRPASRCWPASR